MLNFDALPTSKFEKKNTEFKPVAGVYYAHISKTEVRKSQAGNEYLAVTMDLTDKDGKKKGKLFDNIFDSDKPFLQYKLRRFIEACRIPAEGQMKLEDLGKLVQDSNLVVWTQIGEFNGKEKQEANLRDAEGYYLTESFDEVYNIWAKVNDVEPLTPEDAFKKIDEADAEELPFDDEF